MDARSQEDWPRHENKSRDLLWLESQQLGFFLFTIVRIREWVSVELL